VKQTPSSSVEGGPGEQLCGKVAVGPGAGLGVSSSSVLLMQPQDI